MTKIKEILEANIVAYAVSGEAYIAKQSIDTAASAIEKVHDEDLIEFYEWMNSNCTRNGVDAWLTKGTGFKNHTSAQLIHLYKNK